MYRVMESQVLVEEEKCMSYGIACCGQNIPDITVSQCGLDELVKLCNQLELSTVHLYDIVEDFLAS